VKNACFFNALPVLIILPNVYYTERQDKMDKKIKRTIKLSVGGVLGAATALGVLHLYNEFVRENPDEDEFETFRTEEETTGKQPGREYIDINISTPCEPAAPAEAPKSEE